MSVLRDTETIFSRNKCLFIDAYTGNKNLVMVNKTQLKDNSVTKLNNTITLQITALT